MGDKHRRLIVRAMRLMVWIVGIALVSTACLPVPGPRTYRGQAGAPRLALIGHSIPHSALGDLRADLRVVHRVRIVTRPGATMADALPWVEAVVDSDPDTVVMALGENDLIQWVQPEVRRWRVWRLLAELDGVRCIVWVNARDIGHPAYGRNWTKAAQGFNEGLDAIASNDERVHIADWASHARDNPGWFLADRLHLNARGQAAYSDFVDRSVTASCGGAAARTFG